MNRLFTILICSLYLLPVGGATAQTLDDFDVRESEREGESIELVAVDSSGNRKALSGTYPFSINGFETDLEFSDGSAYLPRNVASSTFLYLKYRSAESNRTRLFYVYRGLAGGFTVLHIPLVLLIAIPLALILIGMFFRRLIIFMLLLLGAFFYFNSSKGFSLDSFFDAIKEWISGLLQVIMG